MYWLGGGVDDYVRPKRHLIRLELDWAAESERPELCIKAVEQLSALSSLFGELEDVRDADANVVVEIAREHSLKRSHAEPIAGTDKRPLNELWIVRRYGAYDRFLG